MSLPKIDFDPSEIQGQFVEYFHKFLEEKSTNGYWFNVPVTIRFDQESDEKVFVMGFFKNRNAFDDKDVSIYFTYYDGCNCPHLVETPGNRYSIFEIDKVQLSHQWLAYKQCESELNNSN